MVYQHLPGRVRRLNHSSWGQVCEQAQLLQYLVQRPSFEGVEHGHSDEKVQILDKPDTKQNSNAVGGYLPHERNAHAANAGGAIPPQKAKCGMGMTLEANTKVELTSRCRGFRVELSACTRHTQSG